MRRKSDKDVLKENKWLIIVSVLFILLGILLPILPHIVPTVNYDSLQTKEVTISVFKRNNGGRYGVSYDYIRTTDGEKYNISGDYQREQLKELLTEGKVVTIKWYKNEPFWTLLAEEIYVDSERVVTYDNDSPVEWKIPLIFGLFVSVLGLCGLFLFRFFLKNSSAAASSSRLGDFAESGKRIRFFGSSPYFLLISAINCPSPGDL